MLHGVLKVWAIWFGSLALLCYPLGEFHGGPTFCGWYWKYSDCRSIPSPKQLKSMIGNGSVMPWDIVGLVFVRHLGAKDNANGVTDFLFL